MNVPSAGFGSVMRRERSYMEEKEKVLLVGVDTGEEEDFERSMKELGELAKACNMQVAGMVTQKMDSVNKAFYIGTGKVTEVKEYAEALEADLVIFDNSLTPSQLRNLQKEIDRPQSQMSAASRFHYCLILIDSQNRFGI